MPRVLHIPGGWLVVCDDCTPRWETYYERRPAAERASHNHRKTKHKETP